jgi:hypothetical protein
VKGRRADVTALERPSVVDVAKLLAEALVELGFTDYARIVSNDIRPRVRVAGVAFHTTQLEVDHAPRAPEQGTTHRRHDAMTANGNAEGFDTHRLGWCINVLVSRRVIGLGRVQSINEHYHGVGLPRYESSVCVQPLSEVLTRYWLERGRHLPSKDSYKAAMRDALEIWGDITVNDLGASKQLHFINTLRNPPTLPNGSPNPDHSPDCIQMADSSIDRRLRCVWAACAMSRRA